MKAKKFKIRVQANPVDMKNQLLEIAKDQLNPHSKNRDYDLVITFNRLEDLSKVLSPQRVRLIQAVRELKPQSIYQLAKLLSRAVQNVYRDVNELAALGILELKAPTKKSGRKSVIPLFKWDGFDIAV